MWRGLFCAGLGRLPTVMSRRQPARPPPTGSNRPTAPTDRPQVLRGSRSSYKKKTATPPCSIPVPLPPSHWSLALRLAARLDERALLRLPPVRRCYEAGIEEFILKPFRVEDLMRVCSATLSRRALAAAAAHVAGGGAAGVSGAAGHGGAGVGHGGTGAVMAS